MPIVQKIILLLLVFSGAIGMIIPWIGIATSDNDRIQKILWTIFIANFIFLISLSCGGLVYLIVAA